MYSTSSNLAQGAQISDRRQCWPKGYGFDLETVPGKNPKKVQPRTRYSGGNAKWNYPEFRTTFPAILMNWANKPSSREFTTQHHTKPQKSRFQKRRRSCRQSCRHLDSIFDEVGRKTLVPEVHHTISHEAPHDTTRNDGKMGFNTSS